MTNINSKDKKCGNIQFVVFNVFEKLNNIKFIRNKKVQTSRLSHFLILENVTNIDVCHIANMRKDENIEFTLVNREKK